MSLDDDAGGQGKTVEVNFDDDGECGGDPFNKLVVGLDNCDDREDFMEATMTTEQVETTIQAIAQSELDFEAIAQGNLEATLTVDQVEMTVEQPKVQGDEQGDDMTKKHETITKIDRHFKQHIVVQFQG